MGCCVSPVPVAAWIRKRRQCDAGAFELAQKEDVGAHGVEQSAGAADKMSLLNTVCQQGVRCRHALQCAQQWVNVWLAHTLAVADASQDTLAVADVSQDASLAPLLLSFFLSLRPFCV